ncbi:response regulator transcription factor [bacterium]|nr:MAG: response regulator transcription factor [bacterium]
MKVLLIEDDKTLQLMMKTVLEKNNYEVETSLFGEDGLKRATESNYSCIVLDMGLPDVDGTEVLKLLRNEQNQTPVLIVSARDGVDNKVKGLHLGADDYLTKPFDFKEFLARIDALIRRSQGSGVVKSDEIMIGDIWLNLITRDVKVANKPVILTNNEFKLLVYMIQNKNRIISRDELSENVWGINFDTHTNFVNVYISYLRKKLKEYSKNDYIQTVRGEGFMFSMEGL